MTVTVLGSSAAIPAHGRYLSATLVRVGPRLVLLDCGEGTQMRLLAARVSPMRLDAVCITHLHGDHVFGLPGLLSSLAVQGRTAPLVLAGPEGLAPLLDGLSGVQPDALPFPLDLRLWPHDDARAAHSTVNVYADAHVCITAHALVHRVATMGYRVETPVRPGRLDAEAARARGVTDVADFRRLKAGEDVTAPDGSCVRAADVVAAPERPRAVGYALDTTPCDGARRLAENADLLLHDATFADALLDRAVHTRHSTARQAAEAARDAGARRLLLTHLSARYDDPSGLLAEAREVFPATDVAVELSPVALP